VQGDVTPTTSRSPVSDPAAEVTASDFHIALSIAQNSANSIIYCELERSATSQVIAGEAGQFTT